MKIIKIILNTIYWVFLLLLILVAVSAAFSVFNTPVGYRLLVVSSGSMEPAIKMGSVVLVAPQKNYKVNDIVTYLISADANINKPNSTVTHRIISAGKEGPKTYITKGDANKSVDIKEVESNLILGKTVFSLPYVGYLVAFVKTRIGFISLIVFPVFLIIFGELISIIKEVVRLFKERKVKKQQKHK